jgi:hypothetical protein
MRDSGKENRALRSGGLQLQDWSETIGREVSVESFSQHVLRKSTFLSTVIIGCYYQTWMLMPPGFCCDFSSGRYLGDILN